MKERKEIHILVDATLKMHVKIDQNKTAMNKVNEFLLHLAKMSDFQPGYLNRVHIHVGDNYIPFGEGNAEKTIRDAEKVIYEVSKENDFLYLWNAALSGDRDDDNIFFIISSVVDDRVLSLFEEFQEKLIFLDFSGKKIEISPEYKSRVHVVKNRDVKKCAKKIHKNFLKEYLTTVNFGFSMKTEFFPVLQHDEDDYDLKSITVVASSTFQPLEAQPILAKGFILPVDECYDKKGKKVKSASAYKILKALLGEEIEPKIKEEDTSMDTTKDDSMTTSKDDNKTNNTENVIAEIKEEIKEEVMEEEVKEEEVKEEEVKEDTEPELKTPAKASRKRKPKNDDDDDDDEEYTPTKRKATSRKTAKATGRGGKRKTVKEDVPVAKTPAKPGKGRKAKKIVEEEQEDEDEPMEQEATKEPGKAEEQQAETKEGEKPVEVVEEIPDPVFLVACALERDTGIRRPVILRLRGLEQQDKTFYDEETKKLKIEEKAAAAKAEAAELEAKEQQARQEAADMEQAQLEALRRQYEYEMAQHNAPSATPMEEDSPESPPPYDCPASPDMVPVVAQDVKIIPTIATIPLEPDAMEPEEPSEDTDFRTVTPVKMIPLEPVGEEKSPNKSGDQNELNVSEELADNSGGAEMKEATCIVDESDVPEEPEDLLKVQHTPVKTIPVDSCIETSDNNNQSVDAELVKDAVKEEEEEEKYIEVIVLDMTWDKFREQVALADDEEAIEELTERELEMPGVEPLHDYTKLTGWYSPEAMQFYLNKLFRAMRKLHDRRPLYDNEIRNMKQMVLYGQSADLAWNFSMLLRDEDNVVPEDFLPLLESTAQEFDKLYYEVSKRSPIRRPALPRRFHHSQHHHQKHYSSHYQSQQHHSRHPYGHNSQHYSNHSHSSPHNSPHKKQQYNQHNY